MHYVGWGSRGAGLLAGIAALAFGAGSLMGQTPAPAAPRSLTLEEALRIAEDQSEQVAIARAGVARARGDVIRARSARLPQLSASASYQRTLASQFEGVFGGGPDSVAPPLPICQDSFNPDPNLPLEQRVGLLESRLGCPPGGGFDGIDFSGAGFGSENTYNVNLSFSVPVFTGGRLPAQERIAQAGRAVAEIGLTSAQAQLRLDVTQAYFDALLADQLLEIADSALAQAEETLRLTELGQQVGQQAEFDVLRARVARDNQRPVVIQRRTQRDLAYDRLRMFLNLPMDQPLTLSTGLENVAAGPGDADTVGIERAPVRQAAQAVQVQEGQLRIAQAQRLPNISLSSQYGQVAFPNTLFPEAGQFRDNWTVGASLQIPIFTGGRIRGDVLVAEASVAEAEAQLRQTRELAMLDTRNTLAQLEAARATWQASQGTVEQAERAYAIAELRYREGLSNLLELNDARLLLQQAQTNQASAARDLQVAQVRLALLPYLPISVASGIAPGANAGVPNGAGASRAAETQPPQIPTQPGAGGSPGAGPSGGPQRFP